MTREHKITLVVGIAALLLAGVFLRGWLLERKARNQAEAVTAAQEKVIASAQQAIVVRDAVAAQKDKILEAQSAAMQTPQQAVQVITRYLPAPTGAPASPGPVVIAKADLSPAAQKDVPDSPSYTIFTQAQTLAQAKADLACTVTQNDLSTCKADLADRQTQLTAKTAESTSWENAAKGGTKFHRFLGIGKKVLCGAAGAYVGAKVDKTSPATAAAIGSAAGITTCSLF